MENNHVPTCHQNNNPSKQKIVLQTNLYEHPGATRITSEPSGPLHFCGVVVRRWEMCGSYLWYLVVTRCYMNHLFGGMVPCTFHPLFGQPGVSGTGAGVLEVLLAVALCVLPTLGTLVGALVCERQEGFKAAGCGKRSRWGAAFVILVRISLRQGSATNLFEEVPFASRLAGRFSLREAGMHAVALRRMGGCAGAWAAEQTLVDTVCQACGCLVENMGMAFYHTSHIHSYPFPHSWLSQVRRCISFYKLRCPR